MMTTTSIHLGHEISRILNSTNFGDGYTEHEESALHAALISKFEELAHQATGDDTISYSAYTSEIRYECWGRTTHEHHCQDSKTAWPCDEDGIPTVDFSSLAEEAGEWVSEHIEEIIIDDGTRARR